MTAENKHLADCWLREGRELCHCVCYHWIGERERLLEGVVKEFMAARKGLPAPELAAIFDRAAAALSIFQHTKVYEMDGSRHCTVCRKTWHKRNGVWEEEPRCISPAPSIKSDPAVPLGEIQIRHGKTNMALARIVNIPEPIKH